MSYTTGGHTVFHNRYHLVWITKYRFKILTPEMRLRIREITYQICKQLGVTIVKGPVPSKLHFRTNFKIRI